MTTPTPTFTIPNRLLVSRVSPRNTHAIPVVTLPVILAYLKRVEEFQKPEDETVSLSRIHVSFSEGRLWAQRLGVGGLNPEKMLFTSNGASQAATITLPGYEFGNLKKLAALDTQAEQLATMVWAKWAAQQRKASRVRMFHTKDPDTQAVKRCIRSVHSADYAPYSNVQFVEDIIQAGGPLSTLGVLDWTVMDNTMRIRFLAGSQEEAEAGDGLSPTIEAWNSEVGCRKVVLRSGMWRAKTATALGTADGREEYAWRHYGNPDRIRSGVAGAFESLVLAAEGIVGAYRRALDVTIDQAMKWMEEQMVAQEMSQRAIEASKAAFVDTEITPGGKLASVVDAITVAARQEPDIETQYDIEACASKVLKAGLDQASKEG